MCWCLNVKAVVVDDLYKVTVLVDSQSPADRAVAIESAFAILLVRITGDSRVLATESGIELMAMAEQYVRSFRYDVVTSGLELSNASAEALPSGASEALAPMSAEQFVLSVLFDENSVNEVLWKKQLPVWDKTRPSILVWVAVQESETRRILDANEPSVMLDALKKYADLRGLPLLFPLMDLEDQMNIRTTDVWGGFGEPILRASKRYQTEAVMTGRVFRDPFGTWKARWTLYQAESSKSWDAVGDELLVLAQRGIDNVADELAMRYAYVSSESEFTNVYYEVMVNEVSDLADYVRTMRYLSSLAPVTTLNVARIERARVLYRVELRGQRKGFEQAIELGAILAVMPNQLDAETVPEYLTYRLLP